MLLALVSAAFVWRLDRELARTDAERRVAEEATALIVDVIGRVDPARAQGQELTLREALDQSVQRLREARDVPDSVRARLLEAIGNTYQSLSQSAAAITLLSEAADAYARIDAHEGQERALQSHALALQGLGRYPEAQAAIEALLKLRAGREHLGDALDAELHGSLGNLHQRGDPG